MLTRYNQPLKREYSNLFLCRLFILLIIAIFIFEPSEVFSDNNPQLITGKDSAQMAFIPSGKFMMGTNDKELFPIAPEHEVFVDDFYMDVSEVTNEQFARFLNDAKPSESFNGERLNWVILRSDLDFEETSNLWPTEILYENNMYQAFPGFEQFPVITVSWYAADAYCKWANKRLPTEAEWERAARGGLESKIYPWGDAIPTVGVVYNRSWKSNQDPPPTEKVSSFNPNKFGLYDMAGNVWEWCSDWYNDNYYRVSVKNNPKGPESGTMKVLRGGAWYSSSIIIGVAFRNWSPPWMTEEGVGFRCVKDINNQEQHENE